MENVNTIASYIFNCYKDKYGVNIDEMKLHKLMYFVQRESLVQTGKPLFDAVFYGWKYGPILKEVRVAYRDLNFERFEDGELNNESRKILDKVFTDLAAKDSWSLSRLTHGEYCWKQSRQGIADEENSDVAINLDDMMVDAKRIKERRAMLNQLGLI